MRNEEWKRRGVFLPFLIPHSAFLQGHSPILKESRYCPTSFPFTNSSEPRATTWNSRCPDRTIRERYICFLSGRSISTSRPGRLPLPTSIFFAERSFPFRLLTLPLTVLSRKVSCLPSMALAGTSL